MTEPVKEELSEVWEKAVRSSHHFLTEQDLNYYRSRMENVYLPAVEIYTIKKQRRIVAFMGLSDEMVEMLFVLPSKKVMVTAQPCSILPCRRNISTKSM